MEQKNELKWIVTARPMDGYVLHLTFDGSIDIAPEYIYEIGQAA